jgi:hypothetical protein
MRTMATSVYPKSSRLVGWASPGSVQFRAIASIVSFISAPVTLTPTSSHDRQPWAATYGHSG